MVQKKSAAAARPSTGKNANIQALRAQIDKIDHQILTLINDRAKLAIEIGKQKANDGLQVFSPEREDEILNRVVHENTGPLDERAVRAVFRELMSGSRAVQRLLRVAYLGPPFSFSHLAALEKFGDSVEYFPIGSISGVFEIVNRRQADIGLVPIENSTDGRIADTLDMFTRLPVKICAEVSLRIHHNLMALCPQMEIRRVYSKPQALSQCRNWLTTNLPQAQVKEVASTTTAVQLAKQEPFAAAVASRQAAVAYGLNILAEKIEDRENNFTRFAIIGHQLAERTGDDKTAIMFQTDDQPGALFEALSAFKTNKVNMTWIESFPAASEGKHLEYLFFVDMSGHLEDAKVKKALAMLEKQCRKLVVLGTFPRGSCYH